MNGELATCFKSSSLLTLLMLLIVILIGTFPRPLLPIADGLKILIGFERELVGDTGFCVGNILGDIPVVSGCKLGIKNGDDFGVADPDDGGDVTVDGHCCCCCNNCCCC